MIFGKPFSVGHGEDSKTWVMTQHKRRERNVECDGLQIARRHVDDQSLNISPQDLVSAEHHGVDVPVIEIRFSGI